MNDILADARLKKRISSTSSCGQPHKKSKSIHQRPTTFSNESLKNYTFLCAECSGFIEDSDIKDEFLNEPFCDHCVDRPLLCNFWIPLHTVEVDQSVLAILLDSHTLDDYYLVDSTSTDIPKNYKSQSDCLVWVTADFQAGDIVFFDSSLVS